MLMVLYIILYTIPCGICRCGIIVLHTTEMHRML